MFHPDDDTQLPPDELTVGPVVVASVDSIRHLGLHLNSDMSMDAHIKLVVRCFGILRQIRCIRHLLSREALASGDARYVIHRI